MLERLPPLGRLWLEMFMHVSIFVMLAFLLWYNVPVIQLGGQTKCSPPSGPTRSGSVRSRVGCVLIGLYQDPSCPPVRFQQFRSTR